MDTNKMFAEFEAAFVAKYGFGRLAASANADAHAMYEAAKWAWQASRSTIEVNLPAERRIRHMPTPDENSSYNEALENCRDAIEAQGLKVEVKP